MAMVPDDGYRDAEGDGYSDADRDGSSGNDGITVSCGDGDADTNHWDSDEHGDGHNDCGGHGVGDSKQMMCMVGVLVLMKNSDGDCRCYHDEADEGRRTSN